jgi:2,5-diketo-D-gluconate reductase A
MTTPSIPQLEIAPGVRIPQIGFGLFKVDPSEAQRVTEEAIAAGYRHIDTATIYRNEAAVGAALAASGLPRDEFFLTTKVWNDAHGAVETRDAFERSRDALGVETVDLYLVHWPVPTRGRYVAAWEALQKIHADGHARAIGVSNFLVEHLEAIREVGGVEPAVDQIEVHPTNQDRDLIAHCGARGIAVQAYSPLARGRAVDLPEVAAIAERHGRSIPQVILRWHLQSGRVVLPKTVTPSRMRENLDVTDFELTAQEVRAFDALDRGERIGADPRSFVG